MSGIDNGEYSVNLSAKGYEWIKEAKETLNLPSEEDVLNLSLSMLNWAISKTKIGEDIGSINSNSNFTKVNIDDLEKVKEKFKEKNTDLKKNT